MGTPRKDRTRDLYGSAVVLGKDPLNPRLWVIRWGCCGREQAVSAERCSHLSSTKPKRCISCVQSMNSEDDASAAERDKRDRRAALKALENRPDERPTEAVRIPGRLPGAGWWPVLQGPMGPRFGRGTAHMNDKRESSA